MTKRAAPGDKTLGGKTLDAGRVTAKEERKTKRGAAAQQSDQSFTAEDDSKRTPNKSELEESHDDSQSVDHPTGGTKRSLKRSRTGVATL